MDIPQASHGMARDGTTCRRSLLLASSVWLLGATGCSTTTGQVGSQESPAAFPAVDTRGMAAWRARLIGVLRIEYRAQPSGTKYSQDIDEAWCADFVSWSQHTAGRSLRNPNSGGWRIPGTMTLLDELRRTGAWYPHPGSHRPVAGDIAIYDGQGPFGQHTNFVLARDGDRITTLGGNEGAQPLTISDHRLDASLGLLGFGHLA